MGPRCVGTVLLAVARGVFRLVARAGRKGRGEISARGRLKVGLGWGDVRGGVTTPSRQLFAFHLWPLPFYPTADLSSQALGLRTPHA